MRHRALDASRFASHSKINNIPVRFPFFLSFLRVLEVEKFATERGSEGCADRFESSRYRGRFSDVKRGMTRNVCLHVANTKRRSVTFSIPIRLLNQTRSTPCATSLFIFLLSFILHKQHPFASLRTRVCEWRPIS